MAAEGLNFQFCGALVNYDMPWIRCASRSPVVRFRNSQSDSDTHDHIEEF